MPVPSISVFRSTSRSGVNGRSSSLTRTISCRIPPVPFCLLYVDSMLSLPLLPARARENFHMKIIITCLRANRVQCSSSAAEPVISLRDNPRLSTNWDYITRYITVLTRPSTGRDEKTGECDQSVLCQIVFTILMVSVRNLDAMNE
jgi:hypothetical protein